MRRIDKAEAMLLVERELALLPIRFRGCVMCAIAAGYPSDLHILRSNERAVAVLDRFGTRRGHVLVVLRHHIESISRLPWEDYALVQKLAWEAAKALDHVLQAKRVFIAALGSAVARTISFPHHHVHVVPLADGGEPDRPAQVFSWTNGTVVYEHDEAHQLAEAIRVVWDSAAT